MFDTPTSIAEYCAFRVIIPQLDNVRGTKYLYGLNYVAPNHATVCDVEVLVQVQ